ncbi:phosphopentomutase [Patulibacter sp.]|uniref:phosphopentomutase n=1 Tax=Patulibacter sp. TaxID=1912859 RepID=UPI002727CE9A|nr:phosphopentomutase [Patulibacter sp.]MDO9407661.1 phosphopentomutase [Patulibacter sp.]
MSGPDRPSTARRAFVVVLDACGVGALPDAADYGDAGCDTIGHLARLEGGLDLPVLGGLGLGHLTAVQGVPPSPRPAVHGRLAAIGPGKDSISGHWGLMGVAAPDELPSWPTGVPADELGLMGRAAGLPLLSGAVSDGLRALDRWGPEHLRSGRPILYTSSVDSVLQVAAHADVLAEGELHALCRRLHTGLPDASRPARVIARPFTGPPGAFRRTGGRLDVATPAPSRSHLDELRDRGVPVHGVGKVVDVFAGRGFDATTPASTNAAGIEAVDGLLDALPGGLAFVNLVETDDRYGHRKDTAGFHAALRGVDAAVGRWLPRLRPSDLLVLTADHGVDPAAPHAFHTREHAPLLAVAAGPDGAPLSSRHDGTLADVGATVLHWLSGAGTDRVPGRSFLPDAAPVPGG